MLCTKFRNSWTEQSVMYKQVFMWFELGTLHTVLQGLYRDDSRFAPSQWETVLLCNEVSHWLGTSQELALLYTWGICSCTINSITRFMSYGKIVSTVYDYGKWLFLWFEFKIGPIVMTFITYGFTGSICVIYISFTMMSLSVRFAAAIPQLPVQ